jgi:hypothetical protein
MHKNIRILKIFSIMFVLLSINCERDKTPLGVLDAFYPEIDSTYVKKPNIYLYPEANIELEVKIIFPLGGKIVESIPEYGNGWYINVEKSGMIDSKYRFLYYESKTPDLYQYKKGWIVSQYNLYIFIEKKLKQYGFTEPEINDFLEYWIPLLTTYKFYAIYPQEEDIIGNLIKLEFSQNPDSLLRLFFAIKGLENPNFELIEPKIEKFERKGFTVVEWGVI